ncbi:MAG: nitroreductase family protein [Muribaculaceae bacterium]|nr:nitroreductase family protein [Muribaculaceae bacterium]
MKIFNLMMAACILATGCVAQAEVLPKPQTTGGMPLMEAMAARKTSRDIEPAKTITKQELSNMLWAAWGITHDDKRTVATAMNRQELIVYVMTDKMVARYDPAQNTLTTIKEGDFRQLAGRQEFAQTAPINIVLAVDTEKQPRPEFQAYTTGAASQNIYLFCAQAGLKTVVRAMLDNEPLHQLLGMNEHERILYLQTVGR